MTQSLAQHRTIVKNATAALAMYRADLELVHSGDIVGGGEVILAMKIINAKNCIAESTTAIERIEAQMAVATPRQIETPMCNECFTSHNGECL